MIDSLDVTSPLFQNFILLIGSDVFRYIFAILGHISSGSLDLFFGWQPKVSVVLIDFHE